MRRLAHGLAWSLCALIATAARAQSAPNGTVDLGDVMESVDRHHPTIAAARADLAVAEGDRLAAEGGFDPTFRTRGSVSLGTYDYGRIDTALEQPTALWGTRLFAGYRLGRGNIPNYYGEFGTAEFGELRAGVAVPLWRDGPIDRRRATLARAEQNEVAAELNVEAQLNDLSRVAAYRYWECVAASRRLQIARQLLELAESRDGQLGERVRAGDLPAIDRVENQRALLQRRGLVVTAQRAFEQTAIELSLFLRDASGAPIVVTEPSVEVEIAEPSTLEEVAFERAVATALERRAEARRLERLTQQQRIEARFAENQRMPAIDVMAAGSNDFGTASAPSKLYGPQFEASVLVDIPLLNRAATGRAQAAAAAATRLEEQRDLAEDRIRADVRDAVSALRTAYDRIGLARGELTVATELEQAERQRFDLGDTTMLILNLREQATAEARVRLVEALMDYERARALYNFALGSRQP